MNIFRRRERLSPDFIAVPAEPPTAVKDVADVDKRLQLIALTPDRTSYTWALADRLLDQRNAIRPPRVRPVPVVPGRVDSIIDNYGENPW